MIELATKPTIQQIAEFIQAALEHHRFSPRLVRQGIFEHPGFDPELTQTIENDNGDIDAFISAVMLPEGEFGKRAQLLFLAVHPNRRGRGLAAKLYDELEQKLRDRGVKEIIIQDSSLCFGLDLRYKTATTLLLRRSFVQKHVVYDMTMDNGRPIPELPSPEGFTFRNLEPSDIPALLSLCKDQFPGMTRAATFIDNEDPCGVVGAFSQDGRLAAFAGWNEHIFNFTGTAKEFRRLGLGEGVFWRAVKQVRENGFGNDFFISRANLRYYAKAFGCHIRGTLWFMRKELK